MRAPAPRRREWRIAWSQWQTARPRPRAAAAARLFERSSRWRECSWVRIEGAELAGKLGRKRKCALSGIIGHRLGMDGDAVDLRALELEAVFKLGDGFVDLVHGQIVGQCAMARDGNVLARAADSDGVHVRNVVNPGGGGL